MSRQHNCQACCDFCVVNSHLCAVSLSARFCPLYSVSNAYQSEGKHLKILICLVNMGMIHHECLSDQEGEILSKNKNTSRLAVVSTKPRYKIKPKLLVLTRNKKNPIYYYIGLFQKKSTPPRWMGSFFNPPSHLDFLKHKTPPPVWISKTKDPPSRLDFRKKILGLNLIYF